MKILHVLISSLLLLMIYTTAAFAQGDESFVPTMINYQGYLTDPNGTALNGPQDITFWLYDTANGGLPLWTEQHNSVNVVNGLFNVLLGSVASLTAADLTGERYLAIKVGLDAEMGTRMKLASVAYSLQAENAKTLDAVDGSKAFQIVRYSGPGFNDDEYIDYNTHWSTADWSAAIVGFSTGYGDINESGSQTLWNIQMGKVSGEWWLYLRAPTHGSHPDWIIDVMFIRKNLVEESTVNVQ